MSEFACRNGHLMPSGKYRCPECGAKLYTMDGVTDREERLREKYYEENEENYERPKRENKYDLTDGDLDYREEEPYYEEEAHA